MTRPLPARLRAAADEIDTIGPDLLDDPFTVGLVRVLTARGYTRDQLVAVFRGMADAAERLGIGA